MKGKNFTPDSDLRGPKYTFFFYTIDIGIKIMV
jgi:hypothetical protein